MSVPIDSAITLFSHLQSLFELLPQAKNCDAVRFKKRLMNLKKIIHQEARGKSSAELATLPLSTKQIKLVEPLQQHILKSI
ncbi:MAG: ATP-dependent helicase HrpA, partial [Flavobacteriales bacterium]